MVSTGKQKTVMLRVDVTRIIAYRMAPCCITTRELVVSLKYAGTRQATNWPQAFKIVR